MVAIWMVVVTVIIRKNGSYRTYRKTSIHSVY